MTNAFQNVSHKQPDSEKGMLQEPVKLTKQILQKRATENSCFFVESPKLAFNVKALLCLGDRVEASKSSEKLTELSSNSTSGSLRQCGRLWGLHAEAQRDRRERRTEEPQDEESGVLLQQMEVRTPPDSRFLVVSPNVLIAGLQPGGQEQG